jgi:hypothetical protein
MYVKNQQNLHHRNQRECHISHPCCCEPRGELWQLFPVATVPRLWYPPDNCSIRHHQLEYDSDSDFGAGVGAAANTIENIVKTRAQKAYYHDPRFITIKQLVLQPRLSSNTNNIVLAARSPGATPWHTMAATTTTKSSILLYDQ